MKSLKTSIAAVIAMIALTASAWASQKTVTLDVSGMTCEACPITVKKGPPKSSGGFTNRCAVREEAGRGDF